MLTFETTGDTLVVHAEREDIPTTAEEVIDALAHSIDVDFAGMENEGAPVSLGNDRAEYQLRMFLPRFDDRPHRFGIGPAEIKELNEDWEVHVPAYREPGLRLSKPDIGFVTLTVGETDIHGVSYVNPFLLEDLADFVDGMADRQRSVSVCLDCEGYGMAYVTAIDSDTIVVARDDELSETYLSADVSADIDELASSIKRNAIAWREWFDEEDETPETADARIQETIRRMRLAARRLRASQESPSDTMKLWLDLKPEELTEEDGELLVAEMRTMVAKTRSLGRTSVQSTWRIDEKTTVVMATPEGRLQIARVGVSSHYFQGRQLAFVRNDGRVEYGGWCDSKNMGPIREAFRSWCRKVRLLHAKVARETTP